MAREVDLKKPVMIHQNFNQAVTYVLYDVHKGLNTQIGNNCNLEIFTFGRLT